MRLGLGVNEGYVASASKLVGNKQFEFDSSNRSTAEAVHRKRGLLSPAGVSSFTEHLHLSKSHQCQGMETSIERIAYIERG